VTVVTKGGDLADAGRFGLGDEVRLGEVQPPELVDLERTRQRRRVDGLDEGVVRSAPRTPPVVARLASPDGPA